MTSSPKSGESRTVLIASYWFDQTFKYFYDVTQTFPVCYRLLVSVVTGNLFDQTIYCDSVQRCGNIICLKTILPMCQLLLVNNFVWVTNNLIVSLLKENSMRCTRFIIEQWVIRQLACSDTYLLSPIAQFPPSSSFYYT